MKPFINIHTHHLSKDDGVFLFNNRYGFDKEYYTENYFSIGIHPWDANKKLMNRNLEHLIQHPNCIAIGECGLDKLKGPEIELQKEIFIHQLELAVIYHKPVIIHCVKSFQEIQNICKPYLKKIYIIIHGYNKNLELAKQLISQGFYLSLGVEFINKYNISELDLYHLFLETDDNKFLSIQSVYNQMSIKLNLGIDPLKEKINLNFANVFRNL